MALKDVFGTTSDNKEALIFVIENKNGVKVQFTNYGCCLTHLFVPNSNGELADVLLGYDALAGYEHDISSQGCFVGRYANRIKNAKFEIGGETYNLAKLEGENFLHGSIGKKVFNANMIGNNSISFNHVSPDGEDGFPGELSIDVVYTLTDENELVLDYRAKTTAHTHINFTNHSYFNLAGQNALDISDQTLWVNSSRILELDNEFCPTGKILNTADTPFDFSEAKPFGRDISATNPQLENAKGYNICYILEKSRIGALSMAAIAREPFGGRTMRVYTTQPAIQLYTANQLNGKNFGKGGRPFSKRSAFCLETQHYPDSPNHSNFPSTLLSPNEEFHEVTVYQFSW